LQGKKLATITRRRKGLQLHHVMVEVPGHPGGQL